MSLSVDMVAEIKGAFVEAFNTVSARWVSLDDIPYIYSLCDTTAKTAPYLFVSSDRTNALYSSVFGSAITRDFIFEVQAQFFSNWGSGLDLYDTYAALLAEGFSPISNKNHRGSMLPDDYRSRLPTYEAATVVLADNKWLFILAMIKTNFIDIAGTLNDLMKRRHEQQLIQQAE
jgi:hypothetical protein